MFASRGIVPFDTEPVAGGAAHLADISDRTQSIVVGKALAYFLITILCHFVSF